MSLRVQAFKGVQWLSSSTATVVLINFVQTAVLGRLLDIRDFGLTAMIWVFLGFAQMFSDLGFSAAVIQRKEVTSSQLSSIYWLNVLTGCLLAALSWVAAPAFVAYYREPELAGLVPWVAATFIVSALGQQFQTLALRDLNFHRIAIGDILGAMAAFLVATVSAWFGAGAYALVFGGLALAGSRVVWFTSQSWRHWHPSFHFRLQDLAGFMRFGLFQMGDRIANYVWNNTDYALAGRFLGSSSLGVYRIAYETVIRPLGTVNPILNLVALPLFARRQDDNATLRLGFLEMTRLVATIVCPIMAGLCAVAPLAVQVVFGRKWAAAAVIIQILSPFGVLRSLLNPITSVLVGKGLIDRVFCLNLTLAVVLPAAFWFAVQRGLEALSWAAVVSLALVMLLSWKPLYRDTIGLPFRDYLGALVKPVLFSLFMAAVVWAAGRLLPTIVPMPGLRLGLLVGFGVVVYVSLLALFDRAYLKRLREYRSQGAGRSSGRAATWSPQRG